VQVLMVCFEASVGIPLASASRVAREVTRSLISEDCCTNPGESVPFICFCIVIFAFIFVSRHSRVHIGDNVKFKCGDGVA
jgi:hypothetical protein